ncbi:MAG: nucleoside triphosphate pyrophosphohydrolase [Proteocatella sp.]
MSKISYNKLVRNKIPQIIEADNKKVVYEILSDAEYMTMLDDKLNEENTEYQDSKNIEKLADILEVVYTIAMVNGISPGELEEMREIKAEKRGDFSGKVFLKEVIIE